MLTIILGWKTQDIRTEVPKALYIGVDGNEANKAADTARESGDYVKGRIGKLIHPMTIPMPTIPTPKPAAKQPEKPAEIAADPAKSGDGSEIPDPNPEGGDKPSKAKTPKTKTPKT